MRFFDKFMVSIQFISFYFYELTYSAIRIAWDVLTVKNRSRPGIIEVPLDAQSDIEITVVANLITFSPGTMVVGLSEDKKYMRVHSMFLDNEKEAVTEIKEKLEKRVLELMR